LLELDATGDRRKAARLLQESLTTYREMGFPRMIGIVLAALGNVESSAGHREKAERYFAESVRVLIDAGEPREIHFPLEGLADLAYAAGRTERAVTLASAAATYRSSLRGRSTGPVLAGAGTWLDDARAVLSARDFSTAWDAGEALSPHDAIAEATTAGGTTVTAR
jgi:tetratricopeptide (TPR) repeat protein